MTNPIDHGTNAGYAKHLRQGHHLLWNTGQMRRCECCLEAHARYKSGQKAALKARKRALATPETPDLHPDNSIFA